MTAELGGGVGGGRDGPNMLKSHNYTQLGSMPLSQFICTVGEIQLERSEDRLFSFGGRTFPGGWRNSETSFLDLACSGEGHATVGGGTSYCYTLYRTGQAPPAVHMAPGGSHRLAFNPFHFGEILGPGEKGAMKTTSVVPMALEAPHMGELHNIALGGPTAILDECQPRLGHGGLAWWGLRFLLCSRASWRLGYFV